MCWGLGFLTFPEDDEANVGSNPHNDTNSDDNEENSASTDESERDLDIVTELLLEWFQKVVCNKEDDDDILLPKNFRPKQRTVKLEPQATHHV